MSAEAWSAYAGSLEAWLDTAEAAMAGGEPIPEAAFREPANPGHPPVELVQRLTALAQRCGTVCATMAGRRAVLGREIAAVKRVPGVVRNTAGVYLDRAG